MKVKYKVTFYSCQKRRFYDASKERLYGINCLLYYIPTGRYVHNKHDKGKLMTERRPSSERKAEILEAALKVFIRKGYSDTRMDDIVQEIGLSKGALYHHFSSKRDLFITLIENWMDQFAGIQKGKSARGVPSRDLIQRVSLFTAKIFQRNPNWFLVEPEIWAFANRDQEIRVLARKLYTRILSELEGLVQRGIDYGEFKPVNARMVAMSIMTSLHGMIWFVLFQPQDLSVEDYVDLNMNFILNGISANQQNETA